MGSSLAQEAQQALPEQPGADAQGGTWLWVLAGHPPIEAKPPVGLSTSLLADKGHLKKVKTRKPHGFLWIVLLGKLGV